MESDKVFFSTLSPKNILGEIISTLDNYGGKEFAFEKDRWQLQFIFEKQLNVQPVEVDEHGEVKDDEEEPIYESTEMTYNDFKVEHNVDPFIFNHKWKECIDATFC